MKMVKFRFAFAHFDVILLSLLPLNGGKCGKAKCQNLERRKQSGQKPVWNKQYLPSTKPNPTSGSNH
jgi:hypothetical protein